MIRSVDDRKTVCEPRPTIPLDPSRSARLAPATTGAKGEEEQHRAEECGHVGLIIFVAVIL